MAALSSTNLSSISGIDIEPIQVGYNAVTDGPNLLQQGVPASQALGPGVSAATSAAAQAALGAGASTFVQSSLGNLATAGWFVLGVVIVAIGAYLVFRGSPSGEKA